MVEWLIVICFIIISMNNSFTIKTFFWTYIGRQIFHNTRHLTDKSQSHSSIAQFNCGDETLIYFRNDLKKNCCFYNYDDMAGIYLLISRRINVFNFNYNLCMYLQINELGCLEIEKKNVI